MGVDRWRESWRAGRTAFHRPEVHEDLIAHHEIAAVEGEAAHSGRRVRGQMGRDLHPAHREPIDEEVAAGGAGVGRAAEGVGNVPPVSCPPRDDAAAIYYQRTEAAVRPAELAGVVADLDALDQSQLARPLAQPHSFQL